MAVVHVLLAIETGDNPNPEMLARLTAETLERATTGAAKVQSATALPDLTAALEALATWHAKPEDRDHAERHAAADAYHRAAAKLTLGGDPVLILSKRLADGAWRPDDGR